MEDPSQARFQLGNRMGDLDDYVNSFGPVALAIEAYALSLGWKVERFYAHTACVYWRLWLPDQHAGPPTKLYLTTDTVSLEFRGRDTKYPLHDPGSFRAFELRLQLILNASLANRPDY